LEEARSSLAAVEDVDGAVEADLALAEAWWWAAERDRCSACLERAAALMSEGSAPAIRASVLSQMARFYSLFGEPETAIARARESLELAEALGRDDLRAKNLITLGTAQFHRSGADPEEAIANIRAGIDLAVACGDYQQRSRGHVNLCSLLQQSGQLAESESALLEAARLAQVRGHTQAMRFIDGNMIEVELSKGAWDAAERRANEFLAVSGEDGHYIDNMALMALSMIELARDQVELAARDADRAIDAGHRVRDPQVSIPTLAMGAFVHAELGSMDRARAAFDELQPGQFISSVPTAFFAAARLQLTDEFRAATRELSHDTPWDAACDAVLDGRWADAADVFEEIGARPFAALAALRAAEMYASQGTRAAADEYLGRALEFWRSVGAKRYIREGEALLAKSA